MIQSELLGNHVHGTLAGVKVHIWRRGDVYLGRGRYQGKQFGQSLGADAREAACNLRHLLVKLDNGTFERPTEARRRPLKSGLMPRLTLREQCSRFLSETRKLRGKVTAANYQSRLSAVLAFAEQPDATRRWPLAADIDREFAIQLRSALFGRAVARNGHPNAAERPVSPRHVFNILESVRMLCSWGKRPDVNLLPGTFAHPFGKEIVGTKMKKDPLRPIPIPLERRIETVRLMDRWQLSHLAIALVLPLRPEDYSGLMISDIDWERRQLRFGTRLSGYDFNKAGRTFSTPYPSELEPLLRACAGNRREGPLLRTRAIWEGHRASKSAVDSADELRCRFDRLLAELPAGEVQTVQDGKRVFRRLLRELGGVGADSLAKEYKSLLKQIGISRAIRFYDLRASCNTEMDRCRVSHFVQRYVTGHTTDDILLEYVSLDLDAEMQKYFEFLAPLLQAIVRRSTALGLSPGASACRQLEIDFGEA
jgi:integrase